MAVAAEANRVEEGERTFGEKRNRGRVVDRNSLVLSILIGYEGEGNRVSMNSL